MKEIFLNNPKFDEPLPVNWYTSDLDAKVAMVFVGGYGDDRNYYDAILNMLVKTVSDQHVISFSFRGLESKQSYPLKQQVADLQECFDYLVEELGIEKINIVLTSDGAYSTSFLLSSEKNFKYVANVLMLDPADYYIDQGDDLNWNFVWHGDSDFNPTKPLVSDQLQHIQGKVRIHVVHFVVKNYSKDGYIAEDYKDRGMDEENGVPRLSTKMVKAMYTKIPKANRGEYIEDPMLPHALERDGNIDKNRKRVVELIMKYLGR